MKVVIECDVDDSLWGISDYVESLRGLGKDDDEIAVKIIELFNEDIPALLNGAKFTFSGMGIKR